METTRTVRKDSPYVGLDGWVVIKLPSTADTLLVRASVAVAVPEHPTPDQRNRLAADCRRCPALVAARTCISWGVGPLDASLVVVGEAPGAGDPTRDAWQGGNHSGMAYTSAASGRKLRALVADLGYEDEAYYTNAVKCHPPGNRDPTAEERTNCRPYLLEELERVAPAWVLATGKHATQSLFAVADRRVDGFLDLVLTPTELEGLGPPVLPLVHPSYQEVWLSRLGYDRESYLDAIQAVLAES
jgi:DNA polymerase